jgi:hypothetical protein
VVCCLFWMLFDCLMIVVRTLFIYTHAQKHISAFIRHAHKRNFLPQLNCSRLGNKSWQSDYSNVYGTVSSDTVYSCADDFRWGTALQSEVMSRAVHRSRSSGIFCRSRSWSRSWKTPAKTPADKIMKNYFIFQWTFGNGKIKLNDLKLL